jgi:CBS domain-containing protein
MLVQEVMSSPVYTVTAETSVKEALRMLDDHEITALPVVDATGRLVGVVSEVDLLWGALRVDQRRHELPMRDDLDLPHLVSEVMSRHPITVTPSTDLADAVDLMMSSTIKSLPVLEDDRIVGIVSRRDVVHALARSDEAIRAEVDDLLRKVEVHWLVDVMDGVVVVDGPETDSQARLATALAATVAGVVGVEVRRTGGRTPIWRSR